MHHSVKPHETVDYRGILFVEDLGNDTYRLEPASGGTCRKIRSRHWEGRRAAIYQAIDAYWEMEDA